MGLFKILVMGLLAVFTLTQGINAGIKMDRDEVNQRARGRTYISCNNAKTTTCKTHCTGWGYDKCFQNVDGAKTAFVECTCSSFYWEPWRKVRQSQSEYVKRQCGLETEEEVKDLKADLPVGLVNRRGSEKCDTATKDTCKAICETGFTEYCLKDGDKTNGWTYCLCYKK